MEWHLLAAATEFGLSTGRHREEAGVWSSTSLLAQRTSTEPWTQTTVHRWSRLRSLQQQHSLKKNHPIKDLDARLCDSTHTQGFHQHYSVITIFNQLFNRTKRTESTIIVLEVQTCTKVKSFNSFLFSEEHLLFSSPWLSPAFRICS